MRFGENTVLTFVGNLFRTLCVLGFALGMILFVFTFMAGDNLLAAWGFVLALLVVSGVLGWLGVVLLDHRNSIAESDQVTEK